MAGHHLKGGPAIVETPVGQKSMPGDFPVAMKCCHNYEINGFAFYAGSPKATSTNNTNERMNLFTYFF